MKQYISIAIDGPSGSGKSSVAREIAKSLGVLHLNTGALYRAIGLKAYRLGLQPSNAHDIKNHLETTDVRVQFLEGIQHTYLDGEDITPIIKSAITDTYSAAVSDCLAVREKVLVIQQNIAKQMDVVMEGRDITSVVLPNATYKFFVTASLDTRAKRRYDDYVAMGKNMSYEEVKEGLRQRDYNDEHRQHSPLVLTADAVLIETDHETLDQTVQRILSYIKKGA